MTGRAGTNLMQNAAGGRPAALQTRIREKAGRMIGGGKVGSAGPMPLPNPKPAVPALIWVKSARRACAAQITAPPFAAGA